MKYKICYKFGDIINSYICNDSCAMETVIDFMKEKWDMQSISIEAIIEDEEE